MAEVTSGQDLTVIVLNSDEADALQDVLEKAYKAAGEDYFELRELALALNIDF